MYDYVRLCLTICDYVWLCMTMYDNVWLCMTMYDFVWPCLTMYDYVWPCKIMCNYGALCIPFGPVWSHVTLLLNDNYDFFLCPEVTFWFFSSIHVILKKYFNNEMQDQAAIGFLQFVDVQLDLGFWTSLISSFGLIWRLKISFTLSGTTNNLTPPSGTVWSTSVALFELAPKTLFF